MTMKRLVDNDDDDDADNDDDDDDDDDIDDNDDQTCETRASPSPRRPGEGNLSSCRFFYFYR